jgi:hypothetical protein
MSDHGSTLTTGEFSEMTGIAVSTITQMLRQGMIRGEKRKGKWAIYQSETQSPAVLAKTDNEKSDADLGPIFDTPVAGGNTYDVETFSQMTYLTEKGVRLWLATGRLSGSIDAAGNKRVDAANLDRPELRHLIRK